MLDHGLTVTTSWGKDARWFLAVVFYVLASIASLPGIALAGVANWLMPDEYGPP